MRYLGLNLFYVCLFYALMQLPVGGYSLETHYNHLVTALSGGLFGLLGIEVVRSASFLHLETMTLHVLLGCSGLEVLILLSAAILAYPDPALIHRLLWLIGGLVALFMAAIARVIVLGVTGLYAPHLLRLVHDYLTQAVMIVLALGFFLLYLSRARKNHAAV